MKPVEKRRNAPDMPLDNCSSICASTLERLSLRGADDEVMDELVVGLFATH
jgi:hypothetical protein